jgi:HemX protein
MMIYFHIVCAFLGQIFSVIASGCSLLFLLRHHFLKKKKLNFLHFPLETMESYIFYSVLFSVGLYTLSLISGLWFFYFSLNGSLWSKLLWATLVWAWYLFILIAKIYNKISRKIFAQMTIMGFFLILGSIFGTVFF